MRELLYYNFVLLTKFDYFENLGAACCSRQNFVDMAEGTAVYLIGYLHPDEEHKRHQQNQSQRPYGTSTTVKNAPTRLCFRVNPTLPQFAYHGAYLLSRFRSINQLTFEQKNALISLGISTAFLLLHQVTCIPCTNNVICFCFLHIAVGNVGSHCSVHGTKKFFSFLT